MGKLNQRLTSCAIVLLAIAASGCSAIYQQIVATARQPGEQIASTPDKVWNELNCAKRNRPFVQFENMEVLPEMIKPGGRVNFRLVYVLCPVKPSEIVKTRLVRSMLFKGERVAGNVKDSFELKPGRWIVDSFFTLPQDAPLGVYALEVGFDAPGGQPLKQVRSFVVSDEFYLSGE
jgi:hypothetical protein